MKRTLIVLLMTMAVFMVSACENGETIDFETREYALGLQTEISHYRIGSVYETDRESFGVILTSFEAFEAYRQEMFDKAGEGFDDTPYGEYLDCFTPSYFEDNNLVILYVVETSGANAHRVRDIQSDNDTLTIDIAREVPEVGTTDMAYWKIAIKGDKDTLDAQDVNMDFETVDS